MLKPTVKRGLMLDFIPDEINYAEIVNEKRIFCLNNKPISEGSIIYLPTREFRFEDNFAVQFGLELSKSHNKSFNIVIIKSLFTVSDKQKDMFNEGLNFFAKNSAQNDVQFEILEAIPQNAGAYIVDFNPINTLQKLADKTDCAVYEIDSHNIIPARYISNKQEFSAATIRRKIYANIAEFMTEFPINIKIKQNEVHKKLNEFLKNKLDLYAELKNNPTKDVTSGLSPYLHFGFISAQRVALEVYKSNTSRENKEAFLEELIVRKELADNFCLYGKSYNTLDGISEWAKITLNAHKGDIRNYIYSQDEFEQAKTHDELWNKMQNNLVSTGKLHGYLRMYWAKKILEWSDTPENALKTAIYLNDTYALDGNDPNGYVGILWSIGGVHDRPFTNRFVTGKIRYMGSKKVLF